MSDRVLTHHPVPPLLQPIPNPDSPIVAVERAGHDRAEAIALDLAGADGEAVLRTLISDEISRWRDDHKRGHRPDDLVDPAGVADRVFRNIARHGPLTRLLDDDDVWEIMINGPSEIFVKRHRGRSGYHDESFTDDDHVVRTLTKILTSRRERTASSTRPKASRTPSSTAERACTSCTATSREVATWS